MAKLTTYNAREIGRLHYTGFDIVVRSDGAVLRNTGSGWHHYRHAKPGIPAERVLQTRAKSLADQETGKPAMYAFRQRMLAEFPSVTKRAPVYYALKNYPLDVPTMLSSITVMWPTGQALPTRELLLDLCAMLKARKEESLRLVGATGELAEGEQSAKA